MSKGTFDEPLLIDADRVVRGSLGGDHVDLTFHGSRQRNNFLSTQIIPTENDRVRRGLKTFEEGLGWVVIAWYEDEVQPRAR